MFFLNELLFLGHVLCIIFATCIALYLGQNAVVALVGLEGILSNLMISKQMMLFGMHTVCTDVFAIGSIIGLGLIQEFFGKAVAQKTIIINFFLLIFYLVMSGFHVLYIPNEFDTMHDLFAILFKPMPRIIIISMLVYWLIQQFDAWFFGWLKEHHGRLHLSYRLIISTAASQLLDTTLFTFGALYGNVGSVWSIIAISFVIKITAIFICAPSITWIKDNVFARIPWPLNLK